MSPETQTSETDFSVDNQEFGREYEPIAFDNESDVFALTEIDNAVDSEPVDPIVADLLDFKGGYDTDWEKIDRGEGFFHIDQGAIRNVQTGEVWEGFAPGTVEQLEREGIVRLDAIEVGGREIVTHLIKGPGNSVTYEMHATDLRAVNENEDLLFSNNADLLESDTALRHEASESTTWIAPDTIAPESTTVYAQIESRVPNDVSYQQPVTRELEIVTTSESGPDVAARDEEHTNILSDLLMEQLPAFDVETEDVVVLKAPMSRLNLDIVRDARVENVAVREESQMTQTTGELAQATPIQKIERFPEGAIMQINRPREVVVPQQRIEVAPIAAERAVEQPVIATDRPAKEQRAPKVETQLGTKKEVRSEPEHKAETPPEKFRMRRGRERFGSEYRAPVSHRESEEALISTPRSVAETAVIRMLERFAPEAAVERREDSITNVRETPIARAEAPVLPAMRPETELPAPEQLMSRPRLDIEQTDNVVSLETARDERVVRTEIDEVLTAHGLSRTSAVEVAQIAPQEGLLSPLGRRPQLSDVTSDSDPRVLAKKNGVLMLAA